MLLNLIDGFLKTRNDYNEFNSIKLIKSESSKKYKVLKLSYYNKDLEKRALRIELNMKTKKLSYGLWKDSSMQTVKFVNFIKI